MARSARVVQVLRVPILLVALLLPFAAVAVGALTAHARGDRAINGAMAGAITIALLIGLAWIGLGVFGGWRELRVRSSSRDRG